MDHKPRSITKAGVRPRLLLGLVAIATLMAACRLTDHTENDTDGISAGDLHIPASGFDQGGTDRLPAISFDSTELDMGKIAEGVRVEKVFNFTNTGKVDLVLTDVRASCGCTVAKNWPRMPVGPGEKGAITVTFDSEGRPGVQQKTITVVANTTPPTTVLRLTGEVVAPAQQ